jgi:hypothetical protein
VKIIFLSGHYLPRVHEDVLLGLGKEDVLSGKAADLMLSLVHQNDFDNPVRESCQTRDNPVVPTV